MDKHRELWAGSVNLHALVADAAAAANPMIGIVSSDTALNVAATLDALAHFVGTARQESSMSESDVYGFSTLLRVMSAALMFDAKELLEKRLRNGDQSSSEGQS